MKIIKRIALLICIAVALLTVAACGKTAESQSSAAPAVSDNGSETSSVVSDSNPSASSAVSAESLPAETEEPTSSSVTASEDASGGTVEDYEVTVGTYTVIDPENSRGLSNEKHGYGFGVAKNGQPHSISVNNQKTFDSMENVDALALDTVSQDSRMYLTFDCGYEYNNLTADILDTLKEKDVKAAFFITLSYAKSNPELVQRMIDEGHIVGNHSATHPVFPDISRTKMAHEIYRVDEYLQEKFNYKSRYFRFPTGAYSENALELVTSVGYKSVFWSLAYADYDVDKQMGSEKAFNTVTSRFHSGAVILLHAISEDNAAVLGDVIDKARAEGYTFKTLDDYIK